MVPWCLCDPTLMSTESFFSGCRQSEELQTEYVPVRYHFRSCKFSLLSVARDGLTKSVFTDIFEENWQLLQLHISFVSLKVLIDLDLYFSLGGGGVPTLFLAALYTSYIW
jgi:hypothetical protein